MPSYLDDYGADDARREKIVKRIIITVIIVSISAGLLYWMLKDYREKGQTKAFLQLVQDGDFEAAYALWGCTESQPCLEYSYEKFLRDWGPDGEYGNISAAHITRTRSCEAGIIQTLEIPEYGDVLLWVDRSDHYISYAPWAICNPHISPADLESPQ